MTLPHRRDWWRHEAGTVWLPTASEMAELDRRATESGAITERALIETAGREVARFVQACWPEGPVVGLAGSGHNGADALVALRCLKAWGRSVRAVGCGSSPPEPDVLSGWEIELEAPEVLDRILPPARVALDGILGTGVRGAPHRAQARLIEQINASGVPVVAVDGPSGADPTTGEVPGACIRASLTVSLGWPKLGLLRFPARRHCGDLVAVEIGFPPSAPPLAARAITAAWARESLLPGRTADAHKGASGYLALVAGQEGMAGAAVLAARAAIRGGAGIVRVVSDPANRGILQSAVPEAVFVEWDDPDAVSDAVGWAHALAVGPGVGRHEARRRLLTQVLAAREQRPIVLDADALNLWAGEVDALAGQLGADDLLTPHPGELARLLETSVAEIVADSPKRARAAAERFGCSVLLKGAPSVVATAGEPLRVATTATPAFASGGVGDVLTGLSGAYLAGGSQAADAGSAALLVSGLAAARAPEPVGHMASDLAERIPEVRREVEEVFRSTWAGVLFASPAPLER